MNPILPFDVNCRVCGALIRAEITLSEGVIAKMYECEQEGYIITVSLHCPYCREINHFEIGISYEIVRKIFLTGQNALREEVNEFQRKMRNNHWDDPGSEPSACN